MRKLESVTDILEALKEEHGWASDYRIGKELGVPQQTVSAWRTGVRSPNEVHALTIGKALNISPVMVLAISAGARTDDKKMQKAWATVVEQIARAGLIGIGAFAVASTVCDSPAKAHNAEPVY